MWHALLRWRYWLLGTIVVLVVVAWYLRRPLGDRLWPEARAQVLREQAGRALAQGRLSAADGSGARELYQAALAVDPDRSDARRGLVRVAETALAQARAAIRAERYPQARRALQLARELSVPRAQADAVAAQLRRGEGAHAGIEQWLAQADAARAVHRLDGDPAAALPLYQRVLALQPERVQALEGREDALSELLQQARLALQRNDVAGAAQIIRAARGYDAGHADLPDAEARLARAVDQARTRAAAALRAGRLQTAALQYQALLQIDPEDVASRHGLDDVVAAWSTRAARLAADFEFAAAGAAVAQARALAPASATVDRAQRAIARARQASVRPRSRLSRSERDRRVRELLQQAADAQSRGDLLTPPGDSAFDRLRTARALSPGDAAVLRASARLLPVARECFERELRANSLGKARACLDATIALEGDGEGVADARTRLAQRWIAIGGERLRAGDLAGARAAWTTARSLDPRAAQIEELEQRLRAAAAIP